MLAMGKTLSEEQRVEKAVMAIMAHETWVGLAAALLIGERKIVDDDNLTACTNGRDEQYGRKFVANLSDAQLRFLVLHEGCHKLFKHLTTWKHLFCTQPQLANMACDYVINGMLVDEDQGKEFITMPKDGLLDTKYRGWDSAEVFFHLRDKIPEGGEPEGGGFDIHDWDGAAERTAEEEELLSVEIDEAIRVGGIVAGKLGSGGERIIDGLLKPQVDWREVLREFIQSVCTGKDYSTWARPNRRYISSGVYMPSGISEHVGDLVIAIDTSCSVGRKEITAFLSEVESVTTIVKPERVRLLYWDTQVVADELYTGEDEVSRIVNSTKPEGGGGTDPRCVTTYMEAHSITPQAVITFTDGYISDWGEWDCPVLWAVYGNERAVPECGKVVHIKEHRLA
jgi:predicted metal-dependent peptidase|tara:strand:- start:805 stop:1992 length:1188 start_codon:yes stop_codon:yes gene_type:complete